MKNTMINSKGIDVQIGKWYDFHNLQSGRATEVKKVTGFVVDADGKCRIVKVQGSAWYDVGSRWLDWIELEHNFNE